MSDQLQVVNLREEAQRDGWRIGDTIVAVNFQPVTSTYEWHRLCQDGFDQAASRENPMYTRRDITTDEIRDVFLLVTVRRPIRPAARSALRVPLANM